MLPEFLDWFIGVGGYALIGGSSFKFAANRTARPENPMETPAPTFAGIFWPVYFPAALGASLIGNKKVRADNRRQQELDEANHRLEVARLEAKRLEIQERSMGMREL